MKGLSVLSIAFFIFLCPFIKNSSSACGLCVTNMSDTIQSHTHTLLRETSLSFSFFFTSSKDLCERVFELKSRQERAITSSPRAARWWPRCWCKSTHTYIYISNARFRFSFAIERERLTVTRRGRTRRRRRKYASRNVRENAPGLSDV